MFVKYENNFGGLRVSDQPMRVFNIRRFSI